MSRYKRLQSEIEKVAKHESGHFFASYIAGFNPGGFTLEISSAGMFIHEGVSGYTNLTLHQPIRDIATLRMYARGRIISLYAGAAAQTLRHGSKSVDTDAMCESLERGNSGDDFSKARELLRVLSNIEYKTDMSDADFEKRLQELNEELYCQAIASVEANSEIILAAASLLSEKVKKAPDNATKFFISKDELAAFDGYRSFFETYKSGNKGAIK